MIEFKIDISQEKLLELDQDQVFTPRFLREFGNALIYHIREEARNDLKLQGNAPTPRGKPEGIPDDPKFFNSFGFEIKPDKTIEIFSTWPWIEQIMEGRSPYPMVWATKPSNKKIPINKKVPVIKTAPGDRDPWIHPGFKSHDFIQRGVDKAFKRFEKNLLNQIVRAWEGRT